MSSCRYEKGPCTLPNLRRHFKCQDGSCPEQVERMCSRPAEGETKPLIHETKPLIHETKPLIHETKPAAPETREEEDTLANPHQKPELATCPECKRPDQALYNCKYKPGAKYCSRCAAKFTMRAKSEAKAGKQKAPSAPAAAKAKSAAPSKAKVKISAPVPPQPPQILTRTDLAGAPTNSAARLVFSLPIPAGTTALELMDLLRSVPSTAVVEG